MIDGPFQVKHQNIFLEAEANQTFIIEIVEVGPIVDVRPAVEKAEVQKIQGNDKIK